MLPKVEDVHLLEFQDRVSKPWQPLLQITPPYPQAGLNIKLEDGCHMTNDASNRLSGDSRPINFTQGAIWNAGDDCRAPMFSNSFDIRNSYIPSRTVSTSTNNLDQADCSAHQVYRDESRTDSSLWPTELDDSQLRYWQSQTTALEAWSDSTQVNQFHWADHVPVYTTPGTSIPYVYSNGGFKQSENSQLPYDHLISPRAAQHLDVQHHPHRSYLARLMQEPEAFEAVFAEPAISDLVSASDRLRAYLDSISGNYETINEAAPDLLLQQWPNQRPPQAVFTGDPEATSVAPGPSISPHWSDLLSVPTNIHTISEKEDLPDEVTVKLESQAEEKMVRRPATAQPTYKCTAGEVQKNFAHEQAQSSFFPGLPFHQSTGSGPGWPIHPGHDPDLLSVCQSSRQTTLEAANETSGTKVKPRKPFGEDKRQETSRTRDIGACVRCKMQRVRCRPNPGNPDGPCIPCLKVASNPSKKVIHHIGCHRYRLQEITIFRTSPTPVNPKRWQNAQVRDVLTYGEPFFVKLKQGFRKPFVIRVSAFIPLKDDETNRAGRDPNTGEEYNEPLGLFALKHAHDVIDDYRAYIKETWYREFADKCAKPENPQCEAEEFVADVYRMGLSHLDHLPSGPNWDLYRSPADWDPRTVSERSFMQGALMMCFVLRQALGHSWIDPEGLDSTLWPRHEKFTPLKGLPGTPRMIVSQLDCIRISCVLRPLAKPLLKVLTTWIAERRHDRWLSIFYASFIFLREIALATYDAYAHAKRKKSYNPKDPKPNHYSIIAEMHESANVVLAHWHYFNCSINLETLDETARSKSPLRRLTPEQFQTMRSLWVRMRLWKAGRPQYATPDENQRDLFTNDLGFKWCHPLYFAAQMFEPIWSPLEVFMG
ncbi:hypothetical protein N0V93_007108 [Gnomoniopsis smithogilvyi]|uniref:Zn(2)-C6 fungal-type domain-containing protein n=1 Tax=Gnomoniopsis smithogilvyi TaxID=1191159 RepID=A0A9W8YS23_9PEZI|nr:hypothetical protein N0V93_007108 [Gnomoniopsis smithogilvyi]